MRCLSNLLTFVALALFLLWFVWLRPCAWGGSVTYILVSGHSMEPTFYTGDLVLLRRAPDYTIGDVVAYRVKGGNVIHRIVGGTSADGFIMLGDNNKGPDPWQPTPDQILGKQWLFVPRAGYYLSGLREPRKMAMVVGLALFWAFGGTILAAPYSAGRKRRRVLERRRRFRAAE